jgi:hypothetical protein
MDNSIVRVAIFAGYQIATFSFLHVDGESIHKVHLGNNLHGVLYPVLGFKKLTVTLAYYQDRR